jgi:ATP-dependent Clp protease ATP-binding subunit ClpB
VNFTPSALDEYHKHIEKDAALERRFQPVFVDEPSVEDTISILRGLKERYEVHHGVRVMEAMRSFSPEFLNRVDEIVIFHSLTPEHLRFYGNTGS